MAQSILLVTERTEECDQLQKDFHKHSYVTWATDQLEKALQYAESLPFFGIIIDLDAKIDGLELCKRLRAALTYWLPIILITSEDDEFNSILGLELGADDYVIKPVQIKPLIARFHAILRRGKLCCKNQKELIPAKDSRLINGELVLDPSRFTLYKNDQSITLTRKEFELLHYFFTNKGRAISRSELFQALESDSRKLDARIIDVFISRIRKKIASPNKGINYIKTVRNLGYMMNDYDEMTSESVHNPVAHRYI
ncbi:DNA-binding response OmpR family regulator [Natronobacillus azotifigens]|uniref:Response regulator transcription factor n=1 Tax=Natronobacillus azotifigens TaxID=472978 RepID=A0A9J6RFP4_9BACI|nr:response regulator transcription factor [Natronobacillus azotifigens]MCZ0704245.1 response regulator transcription factor [Natronobacillus azotifigens]